MFCVVAAEMATHSAADRSNVNTNNRVAKVTHPPQNLHPFCTLCPSSLPPWNCKGHYKITHWRSKVKLGDLFFVADKIFEVKCSFMNFKSHIHNGRQYHCTTDKLG